MSPTEMLPFLEPPHAHDVSSIAHLASLPTNMLDQLPQELHEPLWQLQEAISVVYASYARLQGILAAELDRLVMLPGGRLEAFDEGSFLTYTNQLTNERSYLLEDALPEFKHKLRNIKLDTWLDTPIIHRGQDTTVGQWLDKIHSTVLYWGNEARLVETPDFNETVTEYQSLSTTPTSTTSDGLLGQYNTEETTAVPAERRLGPSKHKAGLGREIEEAMGVRRFS